MFKKASMLFLFGLCLLGLSGIFSSSASAATVEIKDSVGWDIFQGGSFQYRYGPSIIINADNSIDMWTAGPGQNGAWDYIFYRRSTDGGHSWTADVVALAPTAGSRDAFSVCDPGVIKLGSYYYIGYTSTENPAGTHNQIYIARSTSPSSGFQKWNGTGWGGNPQPFISYSGGATFGAGEPSFVEKNGTIYIYYTWLDGTVSQTRVATALASNANWPGTVVYQGAINRDLGGIAGAVGTTIFEDSTDIKYVDSLGKFVGVAVARRLLDKPYIVSYESTDGINFIPSVFVNIDAQSYAHNSGISGTANGHLDTAKNNFVAFAYGPNWGNWNTHLSPIVFKSQPVGVTYSSYVQGSGWQSFVNDNRVSGTVGQNLRDEAVKIQLTSPLAGMNIQYQAHVQNIGWMTAVTNGAIAGTTGQNLRLESLKIALTGTVPAGYHVKYRVHQENIGWSEWALDNQQAGVTGQSKKIESIQVFIYKD